MILSLSAVASQLVKFVLDCSLFTTSCVGERLLTSEGTRDAVISYSEESFGFPHHQN